MEALYHQTDSLEKIKKVTENCSNLDFHVAKEPPSRRPQTKMKVDQLKYDCRHLNSALDTLVRKRVTREREQSEREALLATRFRSNRQVDTAIDVDADLAHGESLSRASSGLDDLLENAQSVLGSLVNQRGLLMTFRTRMVSTAHSLGLSDHMLRLIEKRSTQDRIIMVVGMFISVIVMYLVVKYMTVSSLVSR